MNSYVLAFGPGLPVALVGGKGATLGELATIEGVRVPAGFCVTTEAYGRMDVLAEQVAGFIEEGVAYAVRSSATAEDLPTASFAGQYESYLNIVGLKEVLAHIGMCWDSLFAERAVAYRRQNGIDDDQVRIAVVVQRMVDADAAGVLFTADPVTGNRKVVKIEAVHGLGDALVSGLVNSDVANVLSEGQVSELERIGRKIEAYFGRPQDIEWCMADGVFWIVQSRPITTLFPIPDDGRLENHVYVSVGHQQMMTDAMKPLGLSMWNMTAFRPMSIAGGRLFVDITRELSTAAGRNLMLNVLGKSDPLIRDALTTIVERDFVQLVPDDGAAPARSGFQTLQDFDAAVVGELITRGEAALVEARREIAGKRGLELLAFIAEDALRLKKVVGDPQGFAVIMTAMNAAAWINEKMSEWLGEKNVADVLSQSVANNITSEMGLALLAVADVVRENSGVIEGEKVQAALAAFLSKYGMRCAGEIDITRTRWSEKPELLTPVILANVKNLEPGAGKRKFEQGLREALAKEEELLARLAGLPDGEEKARETKRMIDLVRGLSGYREYPKYALVCRYFVYRQALLGEASRMVEAGVLREKEDIYYLTFEELRAGEIDYTVILRRKEEFRFFERLAPPRVITSEGEIITGAYRREGVPAGALVGLAVSSGVVEGVARVVLRMEDAVLGENDILVTRFTDPSWTPLFVSIRGVVTEVGGLMTHGAVIAREYGLPAVVGVENATRLIRDGDRIRVNGTGGYVELL